MRAVIIRVITNLVLASVFLLSACGQKGPLYLPQDPAAEPASTVTAAPTTTHAPSLDIALAAATAKH